MVVGLPQRIAPFALEIAPKPFNLASRILHDFDYLLTLSGRQMHMAIKTLDKVTTGDAQETKPVGQRAQRKADQQAGNNRNQDRPEIRPIRQSRCSSAQCLPGIRTPNPNS